MIDIETAKKLAVDAIHHSLNIQDEIHRFAVLDEDTLIKPYGWVFSVVPHQYIETRDMKYFPPIGMGPVIVEKDGKVFQLGTYRPQNMIIEEFENRMRPVFKEKYGFE